MKPPPFQYHDPKTLAEAVGLLGTLDNAKLLAGGQSLMPMLNMRFVQPDHVIDLNLVEGMSGPPTESASVVGWWTVPSTGAPSSVSATAEHYHGSEYVFTFVKLLIASCTPSL